MVLAGVGTVALWKFGLNYPLLKEIDIIERFVADCEELIKEKQPNPSVIQVQSALRESC